MPDVRLVFNLDSAHTQEEALHRSGRACRWDKNPGLVISFSNSMECQTIESVQQLVAQVVSEQDSGRVDSRVNKEILLSENQEQQAAATDALEQTYKKQKLASGEAKIGDWESVSSDKGEF